MSSATRTRPDRRFTLGVRRTTVHADVEDNALWIVLGAAVGACVFLMHAFRVNGTPLALRVIMTAWVLAPFGVVLLGHAASSRWSPGARAGLRRGAITAALAALGAYAIDSVRPFFQKAAAIYVVVPPASVVLALALVGFALVASRRRGN